MLSTLTNWVSTAADKFSKKSGLAGFLADPVGRATDYLTDQAVSYAKEKLLPGGSSPISSAVPMPQARYVNAGSAKSSVSGNFGAGQVRLPGENVPRIRTAYENLYANSQSLRVPNVRLTVEYTSPNIKGASGTIPLGTSNVSRQKIKTTTKSALTRL